MRTVNELPSLPRLAPPGVRGALTLLLVALAACAVPTPLRTATTNAFDRDRAVALPAIEALGRGERPEAEAVLVHIRNGPDEERSRAAGLALAELSRRTGRAVPDAAQADDGMPVPARTAAPPEVRVEVEARNAAMEELRRGGDRQGLAAFYADDAVMLGRNGQRIAGR
jgi:hypothetical protein